MTYAYSRLYEACLSLAKHLNVDLDSSIPDPTSLDPLSNDVTRARTFKLKDPRSTRLTNVRVHRDPNFEPPPELMSLRTEIEQQPKPSCLREAVGLQAKIAERSFYAFGGYFPTILLLNEDWEVVDSVTASVADQSDTFLFCRLAADRAAYLKAHAVIWTSEAWIREMKEAHRLPLRQLPIRSERLFVVGADVSDTLHTVSWRIVRDESSHSPKLHEVRDDQTQFYFLQPIISAMKAARV